ncbi:MAG: corrinoid protein [Proteobacteria bacterium]|jgi:corrinoid protein of di/trimethylamine methyltransferase|nr:corrinoid protein [Pseudomonadota bacterium]
MSDTLEKLRQCIIDGDDDMATALAEEALQSGVDVLEIVKTAITPGIEQAGKLWHENIYFMPDVVLSAEAFKAAMQVVKPHVKGRETSSRGKIIIGVVAGDMHDLGKSIVIAMLMGAGFDVIDLGVDVPAETFIEKAKELKPDILGIGCYMTTTMLELKEVVRSLNENGLRNTLKIMIGGVPTTQQFADEIGADAWGRDALDAVAAAKQLIEKVR